MNNAGQVVGRNVVGGKQHAALWQDGVMTDLTTPEITESVAYSINDAGQVVGDAPSDGFSHPFIWDDGDMTLLAELPFSNSSYATGIRYAGQVVGDANLVDPNLGLMNHPFLWQGGAVSDLGAPPGRANTGNPRDLMRNSATANAVNNLGHAAGNGRYWSGSDVRGRATLWRGGVITDLGVIGGSNQSSNAFGINDADQVVGITDTSAGFRAFIWEARVMAELAARANLAESDAFDINDRGQVVGVSQAFGEPRGRASLWEDGALIVLNDLIDPASGWDLTSANSINDAGQIAGVGPIQRRHRRVFADPRAPAGAGHPRYRRHVCIRRD